MSRLLSLALGLVLPLALSLVPPPKAHACNPATQPDASASREHTDIPVNQAANRSESPLAPQRHKPSFADAQSLAR